MSVRRKRQRKGESEDSVQRKRKGWEWVFEETGRDGMTGRLSFCKRRDISFS